MSDPAVGTHDPKATAGLLAWFRLDVNCRDDLGWLRWPGGFVCAVGGCGGGGWRPGDGRFMCAGCGARASVTAGTILGRTRMVAVAGARAETVRALRAGRVEAGSAVVTGGFASCAPALTGYRHGPCLRCSRRAARHRGLVFLRLPELAVAHDPVRRTDLIPGGEVPRQRPPACGPGRAPHSARRAHPPAGHGAAGLTCVAPADRGPRRWVPRSPVVSAVLSSWPEHVRVTGHELVLLWIVVRRTVAFRTGATRRARSEHLS
jgi:hypothetical protein